MCGIAAMISFEGGTPFYGREGGPTLERMCAAIAHRGPDDEGYALFGADNGHVSHFYGSATKRSLRDVLPAGIDECRMSFSVGLAHRRFSIIDLSENGHQPFSDPAGKICMVYNGEIYNYRELREELASNGINFYTSSDTEVVLAAYSYWGVDCFSRFNGFWAVIINDLRSNAIVFSRDRIGKKPLFYYRLGQRLYAASEIKALLAVDEVARHTTVDETAAWEWLALGKKNLDDKTFFTGIKLFPKASYTVFNSDGADNTTCFWQLPKKRFKTADISANTAAATLNSLVHDAVAIRLRCDVPVGLELSGGLDSSVIAASVRSLGVSIPAYTVRFSDPNSDESKFARSVAQHLGCKLSILEPCNDSVWNHINAFTLLEEEPFHSPNLFTNQEIWRVMRQNGIKVSLNGAGGDECFGGYPSSFPCSQIELLSKGNLNLFIRNALGYSEQSNFFLRLLGFIPYSIARGFIDRFPFAWRGYHMRAPATGKNSYRSALSLSRRLHDEMNRTLMPYWLVSGDRGYMGIPIEVREPLLDYRILEYAFTLPAEYLVRDGWHKWILRKAFEHELPQEIIWRRRKMGFPFPVQAFLQKNKNLLETLGRSLPEGLTLRRPIQQLDWKLISFLLWKSRFIDGNSALLSEIELTTTSSDGSEETFLPAYFNLS